MTKNALKMFWNYHDFTKCEKNFNTEAKMTIFDENCEEIYKNDQFRNKNWFVVFIKVTILY